ncbi:MAG: AMP-binding protein [Leptolyngbya sp. SIOISBB]|nr:AMP-binding protein [Leptolyngbya sp. SIOISBB]
MPSRPPAFDIAALELFLPLTVGGTLVVASQDTVRDPQSLAAQLEHHDVTLMQATPATWRLLLESGWSGKANLKLLCGGEALEITLAQRLLNSGAELWNLYGPTETTIWSAALEARSGDVSGRLRPHRTTHCQHPVSRARCPAAPGAPRCPWRIVHWWFGPQSGLLAASGFNDRTVCGKSVFCRWGGRRYAPCCILVASPGACPGRRALRPYRVGTV